MISSMQPPSHSHFPPSHGFHRRQMIRDSRRRTAALLEKRRRESELNTEVSMAVCTQAGKSRSPAHKKKLHFAELSSNKLGLRNSFRKKRNDESARLKEIIMEVDDEFTWRNLTYSPYKMVKLNAADTSSQVVRNLKTSIVAQDDAGADFQSNEVRCVERKESVVVLSPQSRNEPSGVASQSQLEGGDNSCSSFHARNAQQSVEESSNHNQEQHGLQSVQNQPQKSSSKSPRHQPLINWQIYEDLDSNQNWGLYKLRFDSPTSVPRQMSSPPRGSSDVSAFKESTPKASTSTEPDRASVVAAAARVSPSRSTDRSTPCKRPDESECGIYLGEETMETQPKAPPTTHKHSAKQSKKEDDSDDDMEGTDAPAVPETNNSREMKIFKKVLRDSKLREPFYHFLDQQFCAENLNFYVAVEQFRDYYCGDDITPDERAQAASWIYERHFAINCSEPVNVDNSTAKRIKAAMKSGAYPKNTFDLAQYQIFHLLKYDCWPRFLRSGGIQPDFTDEELAAEEDKKIRLDLGIGPINSAAPNSDEESSVAFFTRAQLQEAREADKREREKEARERSEDVPPAEPASSTEKKDKKISHPSSPATQQRFKCDPRECRLIMNDTFTTETIQLNDPMVSVRAWSQKMAERMGLDKRMTEAVDAESGSTIDPARQALDALSSRTVRLCPVVTFAVEILPPNFTAKCPVAPTRYIIIRARSSLSAGAILRPLLGKYFVDLAQAVVCYSSTLQVVRSNASVASIGQRTLTIMNQAQYNDLEQEFLGENAGKRTFPLPKDPVILAPEILEELNLQFHQHGDAGYCELPADVEKKLTKGRKEHLGILNKFVRAVSHTHKDGQGQPDKPEKRLSGRRKSVGQSPTAGVYCGDDVGPSTSAQGDEVDGKKRLSLFRNYFKSKDGTGQISSGPGSATQSPPARDSPRLTPRDRPSLPPPQPRPPLITTNMSPRPAPTQAAGAGGSACGSQENECAPNGHSKAIGAGGKIEGTNVAGGFGSEEAPKTPVIFSTKIDVDATGGMRETGWKHASFV